MNDKIEKQEEYFDLPALNSEGWLSLNDLPGEEWKPIMGYEESYMVSSCGRVKSLDRYVTSKRGYTKFVKGRILRESMSSYGYAVVGIKGKQSGVHRLVAKSFIPNPNGLTEINHKDENKTNNVVNNLEWCDKIYNNQYGTRVKRIKEAQLNDPKNLVQFFVIREIINWFVNILLWRRQTGELESRSIQFFQYVIKNHIVLRREDTSGNMFQTKHLLINFLYLS